MPVATGNRSSLQIHNRGFSASNTVLLTCVMGQLPLRSHPTFSQTFSAMAGFRPGESNRFGVTSRAQHRFVSAFRPSSYAYPALEPGFAESACITVCHIKLWSITYFRAVRLNCPRSRQRVRKAHGIYEAQKQRKYSFFAIIIQHIRKKSMCFGHKYLYFCTEFCAFLMRR